MIFGKSNIGCGCFSGEAVDIFAFSNFFLILRDGISFGIDAASGECVSPGQTYRFQPGTGFVATSESAGRYPGSTLLRIEADDLDGDSARTARDVTRAAIDDLLGGKQLVSRQMYRSLKAHLG